MAVGNGQGVLGIGVGMDKEPQASLLNAQQNAYVNLHYIPLYREHTIYHPIKVHYGF